MPAVQRLVAQATGIAPDASLDPELCVAIGAGMQVDSTAPGSVLLQISSNSVSSASMQIR